MKSISNGDTCHCISESKLSFKPHRSDKIPMPRSIFIKLSSMAENKIVEKNKTILQRFQKSNTSKIFNPKVFLYCTKKMTTRELSLTPNSQIQSFFSKWPLAPYLKENFPTASSSDPCQNNLNRRWGSRDLLISSVEILIN